MVFSMVASEARRRKVRYEMVLAEQLVVSGRPCPKLQRGCPHIAVYVDNGTFLGWCADDVSAALDAVCEFLLEAGLAFKDVVRVSRLHEVIGLILDGEQLEIRNKPSRVWRFYNGVQCSVELQSAAPRALAVLVGHGTHLLQLQPLSLSCYQDVYLPFGL